MRIPSLCCPILPVGERNARLTPPGRYSVNMLFSYKGKAYERMFKRNPRGILEGFDTQQVKDKLMGAELLPVRIPYPENKKWPANNSPH